MNYNAFPYKEVTTPTFTESHLGYVLAIFIRTRGIMYHFVVEVSLFANLKTLWIIAITISMLSYLQENMYMMKGHSVYFHYCNDVERFPCGFSLKARKIYAINICCSTIL